MHRNHKDTDDHQPCGFHFPEEINKEGTERIGHQDIAVPDDVGVDKTNNQQPKGPSVV